MENKTDFSERDSLRLIADTIQQAKAGYYHDSGIGAMLWGSVVSFAGFMTFLQLQLGWKIDFDWWLLALIALVPQFIISRREKRNRVVQTHLGNALDKVWLIFGVSIFAVVFYINIAPTVSNQFLAESGYALLKKNLTTGEVTDYQLQGISVGSLLLIVYAMPTMVTGLVRKFKPMIIGGVVTYLLFIASLFTNSPIDQLLMGISGLVNWLIPGLILNKRYKEARNKANV